MSFRAPALIALTRRPQPVVAHPREREIPATTAVTRLALALVSLGSLVVATPVVVLDVAGPWRPLSLLVFCLVGAGSAPWQLVSGLELPDRLALGILTALGVLTAGSMLMLALRTWTPGLLFAPVAGTCAGLHLVAAHRALVELRTARRLGFELVAGAFRAIRRGSSALPLAVLGFVLCLSAALTHRHLEPHFGGFAGSIGPVWFLGLAALLISLAWSRSDAEGPVAVAVCLLVLVLTLTPAIVYDGPRSQSAAKHVDLVQQIRILHELDAAVPIFRSWRAFFTSMALLCDIAGIRDPMVLATYWPPIIGIFRLAALRFFFGRILSSRYQCWIAGALCTLADPIGMDYFSPQSVGFVIGIVIFAVALSDPDTPRIGRIPLLLAAGVLLAVSHQLSPYIVGGVLVILVIFRQIRPWWVPLLVLGPALLWAVTHRDSLDHFISTSQMFRPGNFRPPKTDVTENLERLPIVGETVIALVLGVMIVCGAALGGVALRHWELRPWALIGCPAAGLAVVAITPYGNEGIFRATIFGLPWLALLAAPVFRAGRHRSGLRLSLLTVVTVLTTTFVVSAFGLDRLNVIRQPDVAAYAYFTAQSGGPTTRHYMLSLGPGDLPSPAPTTTGSHQALTYSANHLALARENLGDRRQSSPEIAPDQEMLRLTTQLLNYTGGPTTGDQLYAIWSPVSSDYGLAYGIQTPARFAELRDAFGRAPYWDVCFAQDGTVVFRFDPVRWQRASAP